MSNVAPGLAQGQHLRSHRGSHSRSNVTSGGVDQLCGFLAATGSKTIYGVNFQKGDVTASAAEAAYVMSKCPLSIEGFEIGNEPDKYGSWSSQSNAVREASRTAISCRAGRSVGRPGLHHWIGCIVQLLHLPTPESAK